MIRKQLYYNNLLVRVVVLLLPAFAFSLTGIIRFHSGFIGRKAVQPGLFPYVGLLLFTTLVWAIVSKYFGLCQLDQLFAPRGKTRRLLTAAGITYGAIMTAMFFYRNVSFSRGFVFMSAVSLVVLAWIARVGFRLFFQHGRQNRSKDCRVLLVGTDSFAVRIRDRLVSGQVMPCRVVSFVRLPGQEVAVRGERVLEMEDISRLAVNNGIDDVIIALPLSRLSEVPALHSKLEALGVPIRAVLDFGERVSVREKLFDFAGTLMLDLHAAPAESIPYLFFKRAFDIVMSVLVITLTSPLMLFIAMAIHLTSPGPILFVQERVGLNGKIFRMYKFRTMHVLDKKQSDTLWTVANDPRCTRLGAFLRRASFDELPQFFNVLMGDMSVVGPRPERPYFVERFLRDFSFYNTRHYLKVGITGWAQINGLRGDTSIEKRLAYDLYYLRNWSLTFDLQILLLTFLRGFSSVNAY